MYASPRRRTDLSDRGVLFGLGASVFDWNDPFARLFQQTLAVIRGRYATGEVSLADLATEYSVGRSTIHHATHDNETPAP